jgi:hypothetical protein
MRHIAHCRSVSTSINSRKTAKSKERQSSTNGNDSVTNWRWHTPTASSRSLRGTVGALEGSPAITIVELTTTKERIEEN